MPQLLRQVVRYRELLFALSKRELTSRYMGSLFGRAWVVLQPLLHLVVYFVVFVQFRSKAMGTESDFVFILLSGLVPWMSIADIAGRSGTFVFQNGNLIKKYAFPVEILPLQMVSVAIFNLVVGLGILGLAVFLFSGYWQLPQYAWILIPLLGFHALFLLGLLYLFSSLAVYIRDLVQVLPVAVLGWFFLSPIFIPEKLMMTAAASSEAAAEVASSAGLIATVHRLNPATYFIGVVRDVFVWRPRLIDEVPMAQRQYWSLPREDITAPPWHDLGMYGLISVVLFIVGYRVFIALKPGFADEI